VAVVNRGRAATVALGHRRNRGRYALDACLVLGVLVGTFGAYAVGLFQVTGGVVVLPGDASVVGGVAAAGFGFRRAGLLPAWLAHFAAFLGFRADWAFLGLSSHSLAGKLAFLADPVGLAVLGVAALLGGTLGFGAGALGRWALDSLAGGPESA
jgi:hypothetical protein